MLFCPLSQNITARRHYVSLVCMYTIHKYVLIQSGTQTWDLSKNVHDRIPGPKILHSKSAQIATILTKKNSVNALISVILVAFLIEFNWVCKILIVSVQNHSCVCALWQSRQISTMVNDTKLWSKSMEIKTQK